MNKTSKKNSFYKVLGNIASYVVFPIILLAVITAVITFVSTPSGKMPQIFGISIVKILSGSMAEAGFNQGEVVFVNQNIYVSSLKSNDIVAFYNVKDPADNDVVTTLIKLSEWDGIVTGENLIIGERTTRTQLEQRKTSVYFHYVNEVYVSPSDGTLYFETIGSYSGANPDGYIRADYILGQYSYTPEFLKVAMGFAITDAGMITLVVFPLALLVLMECLGLIEQANAFAYEIKVFNRSIPFDNDEIKKYNIGKDMEIAKKIYFFATSKEEERQKVFDFLFEHLPKGNEKDKSLYQIAIQAKNILDQSVNDYFLFWQSNLDKKCDKKQLKKLQNQYNYEKCIKNFKR